MHMLRRMAAITLWLLCFLAVASALAALMNAMPQVTTGGCIAAVLFGIAAYLVDD